MGLARCHINGNVRIARTVYTDEVERRNTTQRLVEKESIKSMLSHNDQFGRRHDCKEKLHERKQWKAQRQESSLEPIGLQPTSKEDYVDSNAYTASCVESVQKHQ